MTAISKARVRNRSREGAGQSDRSWNKHQIIAWAAKTQGHALNYVFGRSGVVIDTNAGVGQGVTLPQGDFWEPSQSRSTAEVAVGLASSCGDTTAVLCEKNPVKRAALEARFPDAVILKDHALAVNCIQPTHRWGLIINDPCGPRHAGVEHMQSIGRKLPHSDFIIVVNDGALDRIRGVKKEKFRPAMSAYDWMQDWGEWRRRIDRKQIAVSRRFSQSAGFNFRLLIVTNFLTRAVQTSPLFRTISCE